MTIRQKPKRAGQSHEPVAKRRNRFTAVEAGDFKAKSSLDVILTPAQKVGRHKMALALKAGHVSLPPLCCDHCLSPSITPHPDEPKMFDCITCGKVTTVVQAHTRRRQRIARMIEDAGRTNG